MEHSIDASGDGKARCDCCGKRFASLARHLGKNARCRSFEPVAHPPVHQEAKESDLQKLHFDNALRARAAELLQHLRYDRLAVGLYQLPLEQMLIF